jgi:hypothetical protein
MTVLVPVVAFPLLKHWISCAVRKWNIHHTALTLFHPIFISLDPSKMLSEAVDGW